MNIICINVVIASISSSERSSTSLMSSCIIWIIGLIKDETPLSVKEERLQELNKIVNKYSKSANMNYIDKVVSVLIEGISEKDSNKVFGYTDTMKLVNVVASKETIGKIINVKITEAKSFSLDGEECWF